MVLDELNTFIKEYREQTNITETKDRLQARKREESLDRGCFIGS